MDHRKAANERAAGIDSRQEAGEPHLTPKATACHHVFMPERNLQIAKFIGVTPSMAYCDLCRLVFRTRQEFLLDADKAKEQLRVDFEKHECKPEESAVNEALTHIR